MIALLRNFAVQDFGLKLVALTLAVLIWTTVHFAAVAGPQQTRTLRAVPVRIVSAEDNLRGGRVHPDRVDVTLRGDKAAIQRLTADQVHATADITGEGAAGRLRKRVDVAIPPGVTLVRVSPTDVDVDLASQP